MYCIEAPKTTLTFLERVVLLQVSVLEDWLCTPEGYSRFQTQKKELHACPLIFLFGL